MSKVQQIAEQKRVNRRLRGYYAAYRRAAQDFLASLNVEMVRNKSEVGYFDVYIPDEIEQRISAEWGDVSTMLYNDIYVYKGFRNALHTINHEVEEKFRHWWKRTWRLVELDFSCPPPPKRARDFTVWCGNQRTYYVGQHTLRVVGDKSYRQIQVLSVDMLLIAWDIPGVSLKDLPELLHCYVPTIRAISRLCDWSQVHRFSRAQLQALRKRIQAIKRYYEEHKLFDEEEHKRLLVEEGYKKREYVHVKINIREEKRNA